MGSQRGAELGPGHFYALDLSMCPDKAPPRVLAPPGRVPPTPAPSASRKTSGRKSKPAGLDPRAPEGPATRVAPVPLTQARLVPPPLCREESHTSAAHVRPPASVVTVHALWSSHWSSLFSFSNGFINKKDRGERKLERASGATRGDATAQGCQEGGGQRRRSPHAHRC